MAAVSDAVEEAEELIDEAGDVLEDPAGYLEKKLTNMTLAGVTDTVGLGLDHLAEGLAREAGLASLVDGVISFAEQVGEMISRVPQLVKCLKWAENALFWSLSGGLYAARWQRLISTKEDCYQFVKAGQFSKALGVSAGPWLDMLPCAIEAAFLTPLPPAGSQPPTGSPSAIAQERIAQSALGHAAAALPSQLFKPPPMLQQLAASAGQGISSIS